MYLVHLNIFACLSSSDERTKWDVFEDAMYNNSIVVVATIQKSCEESEQSIHTATIQNGNWLFSDDHKENACVKNSLSIEINQNFKTPISKVIDVIIGAKSSCDSGEFHPNKLIKVKGKFKKVRNYRVGQQYLFVIKEDKDKSIYYVQAGEKLGTNADYFINEYKEFNRVNNLSAPTK